MFYKTKKGASLSVSGGKQLSQEDVDKLEEMALQMLQMHIDEIGIEEYERRVKAREELINRLASGTLTKKRNRK